MPFTGGVFRTAHTGLGLTWLHLKMLHLRILRTHGIATQRASAHGMGRGSTDFIPQVLGCETLCTCIHVCVVCLPAYQRMCPGGAWHR